MRQLLASALPPNNLHTNLRLLSGRELRSCPCPVSFLRTTLSIQFSPQKRKLRVRRRVIQNSTSRFTLIVSPISNVRFNPFTYSASRPRMGDSLFLLRHGREATELAQSRAARLPLIREQSPQKVCGSTIPSLNLRHPQGPRDSFEGCTAQRVIKPPYLNSSQNLSVYSKTPPRTLLRPREQS